MSNDEVKQQMTDDKKKQRKYKSSLERALADEDNSFEKRKKELAEKYMQEVKPTPSNPLGSKVIKMEDEDFLENEFLVVNKQGYMYVEADGQVGIDYPVEMRGKAKQLIGEQKGSISSVSRALAHYYVADAFQKTYGTDAQAYKKSGLDKWIHDDLADKKKALKDSGLLVTPKGEIKYDYKQTSDYKREHPTPVKNQSRSGGR